MRLFLEDGRADVNATQSQGATPFYAACQSGFASVVALLLSDPRVNPNIPRADGVYPLYVATRNNKVEVVRVLLGDKRIDPEQNQNGGTAFMAACAFDLLEIMNIMLQDNRIDPNRTLVTICPLFVACERNSAVVVRLLLKYPRVNHDFKRQNGQTPIWIAASKGHTACVKELIASGRSFDLSTRWVNTGLTPAMEALRMGKYDVFDLLADYATKLDELRKKLRKDLGFVGEMTVSFFSQVLMPFASL